MSELKTIGFWASIFSVVLVFIVLWQTQMMREDLDINNRPWIGGDEFVVLEDKVLFHYQNFGKIPNTGGKIMRLSTNVMPPRDDVLSDRADSSPMQVIMPSQIMTLVISGDDFKKVLQDTREGKRELFLGVLFFYEYGNQKIGWYGVIGQYNPITNHVNIEDMWVN